MSPEQLVKLQELSQVFESGLATTKDIKDLSELLTLINQRDEDDLFKQTRLTLLP